MSGQPRGPCAARAASPAWFAAGLAACVAAAALTPPAAAQPLSDARLHALEALAQLNPLAAQAPLGELARATPASDPRRWRVLFAQARVASELGEFAQVQALAAELAAIKSEQGAAAALCAQAAHERQHVSVRLAVDHLAPLLARATPVLDPALRVPCHLDLARAYAARGQPGPAAQQARLAVQAADAGPADGWLRPMARSLLARRLYGLGDAVQALRYSDEALALARTSDPSGPLTLLMAQVIADRACLTVEGEGAALLRQSLRQQAQALWRQGGGLKGSATAWLDMADDHLQRSEWAAAEAAARAGLNEAQQARAAPELGRVGRHNLGVALMRQGRVAEGQALMRQAVDEWRSLQASQRVADHLAELATHLEAAGQPAAAYAQMVAYREARDQTVSEDREEAVAHLRAELESEHLRQQRQTLQAELSLREEQARQALLLKRLTQVGVALLLLGLLLMALAWRRARSRMRERQHAHARLQAQAMQDPLTGLANRAYAQSWMQSQGRRAQGSVLLIDVDHFKAVNDRLGHAAGDAALAEVASRLRGAVRNGDMLARWGGEEFLLITSRAQDDDAAALAARLLQDVAARPVPGLAEPLRLTVSVGYAALRGPHAPGWKRALSWVDAALYGAKLMGRNQAVGVRRPQPMPTDTVAAHAACQRGDWLAQAGPAAAITAVQAAP